MGLFWPKSLEIIDNILLCPRITSRNRKISIKIDQIWVENPNSCVGPGWTTFRIRSRWRFILTFSSSTNFYGDWHRNFNLHLINLQQSDILSKNHFFLIWKSSISRFSTIFVSKQTYLETFSHEILIFFCKSSFSDSIEIERAFKS